MSRHGGVTAAKVGLERRERRARVVAARVSEPSHCWMRRRSKRLIDCALSSCSSVALECLQLCERVRRSASSPAKLEAAASRRSAQSLTRRLVLPHSAQSQAGINTGSV